VDLNKLKSFKFLEAQTSGTETDMKYYDFFIKDFDGRFKTRDSL